MKILDFHSFDKDFNKILTGNPRRPPPGFLEFFEFELFLIFLIFTLIFIRILQGFYKETEVLGGPRRVLGGPRRS